MTPIVENHMEKKMENGMSTGNYRVVCKELWQLPRNWATARQISSTWSSERNNCNCVSYLGFSKPISATCIHVLRCLSGPLILNTPHIFQYTTMGSI